MRAATFHPLFEGGLCQTCKVGKGRDATPFDQLLSAPPRCVPGLHPVFPVCVCVIRTCTWRCPTCTMTTVTSPTAPCAAAAARFCSAATPTAAGGTSEGHVNTQQKDQTPGSLLLLLLQVLLRGLSGHPGRSRRLQQRSLPGPVAMLHVPAAAAVRRPEAAARLEPQAAGVLRQRQRTRVCEWL